MRRVWGIVLAGVALVPLRALAFDHRAHFAKAQKLGCTDCHPATADADRRRPASHDHAACDKEECHAADFYVRKNQAGHLCTTCHRGPADAFWTDMPLQPFPTERDLDRRDWYAEFSHKLHLKKGGPAAEREMACIHCHQDISEQTRKAERVMHAVCAECHVDTHKKAPMSRCDACHKYRRTEGGRRVKTGPELSDRPERVTAAFDHYKHRFDRRREEKVRVGCDTCHPKAAEADTLGAIVAMEGERTMAGACGSCHKRGQKTADGRRLFTVTGQCTRCHTARFAHGMASPPPGHRG